MLQLHSILPKMIHYTIHKHINICRWTGPRKTECAALRTRVRKLKGKVCSRLTSVTGSAGGLSGYKCPEPPTYAVLRMQSKVTP